MTENKKSMWSRREMLIRSGAIAGLSFSPTRIQAESATTGTAVQKRSNRFVYCLNTSTIRGQELGLLGDIDVAARAGYDAVEVWVRSVEKFLTEGGSLQELDKRIKDHGLTIESAIGFAQWIVDDDAVRSQALEQMKREMDMLAQIGCKRIAAPPSGATRDVQIDLIKAAERYRAILEIGDAAGVVPQLEVWGFSENLHLLGQSMFVAIESGHPKACLLPDVYHIYKGGSDFNGLKLISGKAIQVFHINDYPGEPSRDQIDDSYRLYPGDGIAPLTQILRDLSTAERDTVLSLELFNRDYWKKDAYEVARTGLEKMRNAVEVAGL